MFVVGGAEHHRRARVEGGEVAGGFQAVDAGHRDIQQHHVGGMQRTGVERGGTVAGFRHQLHVGMLGEQCAKTLARQRFVIGDEDFHVIVRPGPMARW